MLIYAHRGYSGAYPENTLLAFREAIASGAAGVELDVHATSDGVPVVIHDRALDRTTNGHGHVDQITLTELQRLDAGRGQSVPRFADVLELVGNQLHIDIEVKGHGIEQQVLEILTQYSNLRWAISSFDWDTLRAFRRLDTAVELWPLAEEVDDRLFAIATELNAPTVALYHAAYSEANAIAIRNAGLQAMVWTVNAVDEALLMQDRGAFGLCTDEPKRIVHAMSGA